MFSAATLRELFRLALPMVVSQSAFALMVFTDRLFMSRIDALHIASALGGGVTFFVTIALFQGVISYATALVAQYLGSGQLAKCPKVVTQGVIMALAVQPLLLLVGWQAAQLFELMGHAPAQVALERQYFFVLLAGSFLALGKTCIASYFSGIARTRVVMISDVLGVLVNVPLSYVLIFGKLGLPQLGIQGAALGTVIATGFSVGVYALFYFNRIHRQRFSVLQSFHFDRGILTRYIRLGLPSGLEVFVGAATFNLFLLLFQSYGVNEGAAMAIVFNWDMLNYVPLIGMNIAVTSMIGRYVGAGDMTRTNQVISAAFLLAVGYSVLLGLFFIIAREQLMNVFATPGEDFSVIVALGSQMMIGLATYVLADAAILIASGVLRGAGDTRWLMNTSMLLHVLMLVSQVVIIKYLDFGPMASWWAFVVMLLMLAAIYLRRLLGSRWRSPERLARVMAE
ncbi:MATE family efflux transporter [Parahaliea mediterranea]|uniref:MATE family efflux transporter n=1 Tax=Parahaliea mediterranea TaxID=651086 RepID=UPI001F4EF68C|nr:MATE family efflux transporter [Parahaliea mediterranea]